MIVNKLVEKAMAKAQGAQASLGQSESTDVSFENDKLKSARSSQSTHMSLKVIVDGKVGSSHTTDINDVDGVVKRALEVAEFGSPAHFQFPSPQEVSDVKTYDDAVLPVTKDEMVSIGAEMMAHYWFENLLQREGLKVPAWSFQEMQNALKNKPMGEVRNNDLFAQKLKEWKIVDRPPARTPRGRN